LYHAALERDSGARAAYLARACEGDEELRREVASLLAQKSGRTVNGPAPEVAADLFAGELSPGAQLGPYRIEGLLQAEAPR
jgi:hypothetical protein